MSTLKVPWNIGEGNITLTYNGWGNDTIYVSSDDNTYPIERRQSFKVIPVHGNANSAVTLTIIQEAGKGEVLITVGREPITLISGETIAVNVI